MIELAPNLPDTPHRRMAHVYWKAGWTNPLPVREKNYPPSGFTGYDGRSVSWPDLMAWLEDPATPANVGLRLQRTLVGIDVDDYEAKHGAASLARAEETLGPLPATWTSTSRGPDQPSRIHLFKIPADASMRGAQRRFAEAFGIDVDIIHFGHRYAVVAPSKHPKTKAEYRWYTPDGDHYLDGEVPRVADLPELPQAWLEFLMAQPEEPTVGHTTQAEGGAPREFNEGEAERFMQTQAIEPLARAQVGEINTTLNNSALIMSHFIPEFITYEEARQRLLLALAETAADAATEQRDHGTIRSGLGAEGGWRAVRKALEDEPVHDDPDADPEIKAPDFFTDEQLSREFYRSVLVDKYLFSRGLGWQTWDGQRWRDTPEEAMLRIVGNWIVQRTKSAFAKDLKLGAAAMRAEGKSMKTLVDCWKPFLKIDRQRAILTLSKGRVLVDPTAFDAEPDILNTPTGIVDLRTGELIPSDPKRMCRKMTRAGYVPGLTHKDWDAALDAVPEDSRVWLQTYLGQAITGYTPAEDTLLVVHGGGSNGKTLVMSVGVQWAIGDYYALVDDAVLMGDRSGGATPEMMELLGARIAVLEETQEARHLDTQRLKKIVGTPVLSARHLYRDLVTFVATHTLIINTNYLPLVKETDHGTWRRLLTMPFPFKFVNGADEVREANHRVGDRGLKERLRSDPQAASAVLTWLVDGARLWYTAGKVMPQSPAAVESATAAWRQRNDQVLGFLATETVVPAAGFHVASKDLLAALNNWLDTQGARPWTDRLLADRLENHDAITKHRIERKRIRGGQSSAGQVSRPPQAPSTGLTGQYVAWLGLKFKDDNEGDTP